MEGARRRRACNAGDCAQIFVDRLNIVVTHVLEGEPRHYLEKVAAERGREAVFGYGGGTSRMEVVKVRAMPHNFKKL